MRNDGPLSRSAGEGAYVLDHNLTRPAQWSQSDTGRLSTANP